MEAVGIECPECEASGVEKRNEMLHAIFADGNGAEYESEYLFCPACGAKFVTGSMMDENLQRARAARDEKRQFEKQEKDDGKFFGDTPCANLPRLGGARQDTTASQF